MNRFLKSVMTAGVALTASVAVAASVLSVKEVNERVVELLAPFNNETTKLAVVFTDLETNDVRVTKFGVESQLSKVGKVNSLDMQLPNIKYVYAGPNGLPYATGEAKFRMDFLKSFKQDFLNEISESLEDMIKDMGADFLKEYGDAATVTPYVDVKRDESNNVVALDIRLEVAVDLAKLPESVDVKEVPLVNFKLSSRFDLMGADLGASAEFNPKYNGFDEDNSGLKEIVEGLLGNNKETYEELQGMVGWVDRIATYLVDTEKEE